MKLFAGFLLITIFIPRLIMAQERIEFNLVFGSYINDSFKKEFHAEERKWIFEENKLTYFIDAHNKTYSDTIILKSLDIQSIINYSVYHLLIVYI